MTTILLAGATGLVGGIALTLMLDDDRVTQVVALTRRPLVPHSKLRNPLVDSGTLPLDAPWWAADAAICALGTTRKKAGSAEAFRAIDHDYVLAIAAQVRRSGARRFALTSSMGAESHSPFLYPRTKGEVEAAVRQLGFPSLTILRPGLLGGERAEHRAIERIMGSVLRIAGPILPASARISPAVTVAQLLIEAALGGQPGTHVITAADIARAAAL